MANVGSDWKNYAITGLVALVVGLLGGVGWNQYSSPWMRERETIHQIIDRVKEKAVQNEMKHREDMQDMRSQLQSINQTLKSNNDELIRIRTIMERQ